MEIVKVSGASGNTERTSISLGTSGAPAGALIIVGLWLPAAALEVTANEPDWVRHATIPGGDYRFEIWQKIASTNQVNVFFAWQTWQKMSAMYVIITDTQLLATGTSSAPTSQASFPAPSLDATSGSHLLTFHAAWASGVAYPSLTAPSGMQLLGQYPGTGAGFGAVLASTSEVTTNGATGPKSATGPTVTDDWAAASFALAASATPPPPPPEPEPVVTQRRYFDAAPVIASVDEAASLADIVAAWSPIKTAYGVELTLDDGTVNSYGVTSTPFTIDDPGCKTTVKLIADQITKYPQQFVKDAALIGVRLVKEMTTSTGGILGGLNVGPFFFMNIDGFAGPVEGSYDKHDGLKFIFHHEFQHTMYGTWQADFDARMTEWKALNPDGFFYSSTDWRSADGTRPTGFVRDYARVSFVEDAADTWGHIMTTEVQPNLESWIATDPGVAGKVQILRDVIATKNPIMADAGYYDTIHTAHAGADKVVEPWGQALIRALGVGTWTKVSGPEVTFTVNGTDLTLDPTPQFTEQQFVFDYGGDQTTITVQPARWGIKQAGAVVPVRLTRKQT